MLQFTQQQHDRQAKARMLAGLIKVNWIRALGMLGLFEDWAANSGKPGEVPEGRLDGPRASQMLAALLEHRGDPDDLVAAFCAIDVLEQTPTGLRAKGLEERYGPMIEAAAKRSKAAQKAANARWSEDDASAAQTLTDEDAPACEPHAPGNADAMRADAKRNEMELKGNKKEREEAAAEAAPLAEQESLELEPSEPDASGEHPLQELWNRLAHPKCPRWEKLSKTRKRIADARLKERSLSEYALIIERANASSFLRGKKWFGLDWLLKPENLQKVIEGNYDDESDPKPAQNRPGTGAPPAHEPKPLPATAAGKLWGRVLEQLAADGRDYALQALERLHPADIEEGALVLEVDDVYFAEWVGSTYGEMLNAAVKEVGGASRVTCRPPAEVAA